MGSLCVKGQFPLQYLDKLHFKVPAIIYHALWVIRLWGALALVKELSSVDVCTCVVCKYDRAFSWLYLLMRLYFLECLGTPLRNLTHTHGVKCSHTSTCIGKLHTCRITCRVSFQTQCECQPVAPLISIPVHQSLPKGPNSSPRGRGPGVWTSSGPLYSAHMPGSGLGKAAVFVYSGQLVHSR